jgi:hypothetical protein
MFLGLFTGVYFFICVHEVAALSYTDYFMITPIIFWDYTDSDAINPIFDGLQTLEIGEIIIKSV